MKALQRDSSDSAIAERRERERIREEKEMQRLMGTSGNTSAISAQKKINLATPKGSFKPVLASNTAWKTVEAPATKSINDLRWGNDGEDDYDPAYPTPA
jgi:hypothetical protein